MGFLNINISEFQNISKYQYHWYSEHRLQGREECHNQHLHKIMTMNKATGRCYILVITPRVSITIKVCIYFFHTVVWIYTVLYWCLSILWHLLGCTKFIVYTKEVYPESTLLDHLWTCSSCTSLQITKTHKTRYFGTHSCSQFPDIP